MGTVRIVNILYEASSLAHDNLTARAVVVKSLIKEETHT